MEIRRRKIRDADTMNWQIYWLQWGQEILVCHKDKIVLLSTEMNRRVFFYISEAFGSDPNIATGQEELAGYVAR